MQENDEYRDRAAAHEINLQRLENELDEKEREIEELLQDLENRDGEHAEELKRLADEWRAEVDDARAREAEARDVSGSDFCSENGS